MSTFYQNTRRCGTLQKQNNFLSNELWFMKIIAIGFSILAIKPVGLPPTIRFNEIAMGNFLPLGIVYTINYRILGCDLII